MPKIRTLRNNIDGIDAEILRLLNRRARLTLEIGHVKEKKSRPLFSPARESDIYSRLLKLNKGPMKEDSVKSIFSEIMSASLSLQGRLKIAYLGPAATFTHIAALKKFGKSLEYAECASIADVFTEVERSRADYGVVPIENSTEGAVNHTLDMFIDSELKICSEVYLPIEHNLLVKGKKARGFIKNVYSRYEVFAQCRIWLEKNLPCAKLISCASTTEAAMAVAAGKACSAIASRLAAQTYGLDIKALSIEDSPHNITRFLVIGKQSTKPTGNDKTSMVFSMNDKAGALHDVLSPFKKSGVNLTKIESRPSKKRAWEYYFFVDMQGHVSDTKISGAIACLRRKAKFLKVLGSYPAVLQPARKR
ncbi:MAG: prephenate dehydratase [Candidatus Omnitrophica bacterium]|nr:prephenate dehydratase [Candidatus Omnitrophota bacterium]